MSSAQADTAETVTREQMIEGTARELYRSGYTWVYTRGGLGGRDEPVPVNGHVPDIKARWADNTILYCVEDADTLHGEESEARWKAFGSSYFTFEVVCPAEIVQEARLLARARGIRVNRFWTY